MAQIQRLTKEVSCVGIVNETYLINTYDGGTNKMKDNPKKKIEGNNKKYTFNIFSDTKKT